MIKNNISREAYKTVAIFGKETEFKGTLKFSKSLQISGRFEGIIEASGFLYIDEGAVVNADIKANSAIISGKVTGNITISDRLEMTSAGQVYGNIKTAKLKIADGVIFEGKCEMIKPGKEIKIFESSRDNLKKALQS